MWVRSDLLNIPSRKAEQGSALGESGLLHFSGVSQESRICSKQGIASCTLIKSQRERVWHSQDLPAELDEHPEALLYICLLV